MTNPTLAAAGSAEWAAESSEQTLAMRLRQLLAATAGAVCSLSGAPGLPPEILDLDDHLLRDIGIDEPTVDRLRALRAAERGGAAWMQGW